MRNSYVLELWGSGSFTLIIGNGKQHYGPQEWELLLGVLTRAAFPMLPKG